MKKGVLVYEKKKFKNGICTTNIWNWRKNAERYGKDNVRYEEEPIYDENGNYVKTITNVYVTMEKVMGFRIFKRHTKTKDTNVKIPKKVKLFETSADKEKDEEEKLKGELK